MPENRILRFANTVEPHLTTTLLLQPLSFDLKKSYVGHRLYLRTPLIRPLR